MLSAGTKQIKRSLLFLNSVMFGLAYFLTLHWCCNLFLANLIFVTCDVIVLDR